MPISIPSSAPDTSGSPIAASSSSDSLDSLPSGNNQPPARKNTAAQSGTPFAEVLMSANASTSAYAGVSTKPAASKSSASSASSSSAPVKPAKPASPDDATSAAQSAAAQAAAQTQSAAHTPVMAMPTFAPAHSPVPAQAAVNAAESEETSTYTTMAGSGGGASKGGYFGSLTSRDLVASASSPSATTFGSVATASASTVTALPVDASLGQQAAAMQAAAGAGRGGKHAATAAVSAASASKTASSALSTTASTPATASTVTAAESEEPGTGQPNVPRESSASSENFADSMFGGNSSGKNFQNGSDKQSQNGGQQTVANVIGGVGTSSAKSISAMSSDPHARAAIAASSTTDAASASAGVAVASASAAQLSAPGLTAMSQASAPAVIPTTAQGAVSTVLRVVDLQASSAQSAASAVNLHFQVGGSNLSVHIELQGGTVHTQFSSSSSDLRTAVASAWQSASGTLSASAVHFAEPTFSSSGGNSQQEPGAQWSDGNAQQQRQASGEDYAAATSFGSTSSGDEEAEAVATAPSSPVPAAYSNRLQTFA